MAITLSRQGGFLKFVEGTNIKYYNLNDITAVIKNTDFVTWCDGRLYRYDDISSPVFASAEAFADQIGIWKAEAQAGAGTLEIPHVNTYNDLPDPTTVSGAYYFVDNSQGTAWLPGGLGGTYYNAGLYRSTGLTWKAAENPYEATLAEVNAGANDSNFLTPFTFNNSDKIQNSFQKNVDTSDQITEGAVQQFVPTYPNDPNLFLNGQRQWVNVAGTSELIVVTNRPPNANDDITQNNFIGQRWIDTSASPNDVYICRVNGAGVAEWEFINQPTFLRYNSIKVVQTIADLPAPVGTEITLADNTIYFIDSGNLDITGYTLIFNQRSQINGFGQNVSAISSSTSGTPGNPYVFFKSGKNLFMNDLEIICNGTNQRIWEHVGDGTVTEGESFELNRFNVLCFQPAGHNNELGYVKDIRQGFIGTMSCIGFENGFICAGAWTGGFRVDNTIFINCSGIFFGSDPLDPVTFARRMSSNANITVPVGSIGYDFPETAFTFDGQYQLQNGNASGAGTYVSNFTSGFPAFDPLANFKDNTGIQNSFPGGEFITTADAITTITTANVWVEANLPSAITKDLTWLIYLLGVFEYDSDNALDAFLIYRLSLTGKANDIVEVKLVKEDALAVQTDLITVPITIQGTTTQGRAESVPISTTGRFVKGDKVKVYYRNTSGTTDITTLTNSNGIISAK